MSASSAPLAVDDSLEGENYQSFEDENDESSVQEDIELAESNTKKATNSNGPWWKSSLLPFSFGASSSVGMQPDTVNDNNMHTNVG